MGSATALVAKVEGKCSDTFSETSEATYDPFWTHAYSFLQNLEANFAVPLERGHMGSLVKFQALVQFLDLKIMRNLWEPSARAYYQSQISGAADSAKPISRKNRRERRQQEGEQIPDGIKFGLEVLKEVPHLLHMTFLAESGYRLWAPAQRGPAEAEDQPADNEPA